MPEGVLYDNYMVLRLFIHGESYDECSQSFFDAVFYHGRK